MMISGTPNLFYLSMLALFMTFLCRCGVEGITFSFNGFKGLSDVYIVPNSPWTYNPNHSSICLAPTNDFLKTSMGGRFLYPKVVQMMDPVTMAAKSFSTSFIYQIFIQDGNSGATGPGMAFIMVPDNFTLGAPLDYMGLLTTNTSINIKNYESDNHTFGVELDTYMNPEFNDPNANHIGIDLASMNSSGGTFMPTNITLATENPILYQQVWIDYFQADSRMDIYLTQYGRGKPATPLGSRVGVDLSLLYEYMYIGFSAAVGIESNNMHTILAWSFSNDGDAPPILIAKDAPPAPSLPPPARRPSTLVPPPSDSPISATNLSIAQVQASLPLTPTSIPSTSPPLSPSPPSPPKSQPVVLILAVVFSTAGAIVLVFCWKIIQGITHPIYLFLAHPAGKDEAGKNFSAWLFHELKSTWRYKFKLMKVFFDKRILPQDQNIPEEIQRELDRMEVGVVIVTKGFFGKKWPMTELLSFVDSKIKNPTRVQILPIFYKLRVGELKDMLRQGYWEEKWMMMSTKEHPMDVQKCREAVELLCKLHGIEYFYDTSNHDCYYIKRILKEVAKISNKRIIKQIFNPCWPHQRNQGSSVFLPVGGTGKDARDIHKFKGWIKKKKNSTSIMKSPSKIDGENSLNLASDLHCIDDSSSNIALEAISISSQLEGIEYGEVNTIYVGPDIQDIFHTDVNSTEIQNNSNIMQPQGLQWLGVLQNLVRMMMTSLHIQQISTYARYGSNNLFQCFQQSGNGIIAGRFDTTVMQIQILFSSLENMVDITGLGLKLEPNSFVQVILNGHDSSKVIMTIIEKNEFEKLISYGDAFYILHLNKNIHQSEDPLDTLFEETLSPTPIDSKYDGFSSTTSKQHENFETMAVDFSTYAAYRVHTVAKLLLLLRCGENGDILYWSKVKDFLSVWNWKDIKMALDDYEEKWKSLFTCSEHLSKRGGDGGGNDSRSYGRAENLSSSRKDKEKCNNKKHGAFRGDGRMGGSEGGDNRQKKSSLLANSFEQAENYTIEVRPGYGCYQEDYNDETWPYKSIHVYATPVITISFRNCSNQNKEVHVKLEVNFDLANNSGPEALDLAKKQFAWYHDAFEFSIQCIDDKAAELKVGSSNVDSLKVVKSMLTNTTTLNSKSSERTFSTEVKTTAALPVQNTTKFSTTKFAPTSSLAAGVTREGLDRQTMKGFMAREKFEGGSKPSIGCAFKYAKSKDIESYIHEADGRFPDMERYLFEQICSSQFEVIEGAFQPRQDNNNYYNYVFNCQRDIIGLFWNEKENQRSSWTSKLKEMMACTSDGRSIKDYKYFTKVTCEQKFEVPLLINHAMTHIHELAEKYPAGIPPLRGHGEYENVLAAHPLKDNNLQTEINI